MFKLLLFFIMTALFGMQAKAFDRIHCQSSMESWIVTLTESNKTAILTPYKTSTELSERDSENLHIKNSKNEIVATVFPWNGLYIRNNKKLEASYEIKSNESSLGFSINIKEIKTKKSYILTCKFTF